MEAARAAASRKFRMAPLTGRAAAALPRGGYDLSRVVNGEPRSRDARRVFRENLVDERLVPDAPALGFLPIDGENPGVEPDRNQPPGLVANRRPADSPERGQLLGRRRGDVRVINLLPPAPSTSRARRGSRGAR